MSPETPILEILTRGAAIGAMVGLAIVIARAPLTPARITGILFCLAAASHNLTQNQIVESVLGPAWPLVWSFSVMGAGLFWAFATELFDDRPRLEPIRFAPAALLLALGIARLLATTSWMVDASLLAQHVIGVAFMVHVLFVIWSGWRNDLVESRRRLRGPILAAGGIYAVAVLAVQIAEIFLDSAAFLSPLAAAVLLLLGLAALGALAQADTELFAIAGKPQPVAITAPGARSTNGEDAKTAERLDQLMRSERAYREEGLSIASLALKVGVPEYKLRRLINQQLGHRNFAAFLNQWRLADAKQALADPSQREVPVSTIALDAGFQSLGPFNRAFKAETGLTPSEFRAQSLASPSGSAGGTQALTT